VSAFKRVPIFDAAQDEAIRTSTVTRSSSSRQRISPPAASTADWTPSTLKHALVLLLRSCLVPNAHALATTTRLAPASLHRRTRAATTRRSVLTGGGSGAKRLALTATAPPGLT